MDSDVIYIFSDTILKKYSSTVATIFTGIASAVLFGHTLTINFMLGISIVFISMHQVIYKDNWREIFWIVWNFFLNKIEYPLFFGFICHAVLFTTSKSQGWTAEWNDRTEGCSWETQVCSLSHSLQVAKVYEIALDNSICSSCNLKKLPTISFKLHMPQGNLI